MWLVEQRHEYTDEVILYAKYKNWQDAVDISYALNFKSQPEDPVYTVREEK